MKRQTRPFAIEIKTSRKPSSPPQGNSRPRSEWIDPFPDDVPERDVFEDVVIVEKSEAFRQAERLFARAKKPARERSFDGAAVVQQPMTAQALVASPPQAEGHIPRILPDLLAQARDERQAQEQLDLEEARHPRALKRSPGFAKPKPVRKPRLVASDERLLESPPVPQTGPATSAHVIALPSPAGGPASAPRWERSSGGLPLGQRWKERRLPRVCWEQPGQRKRQRG